MTEQNRIGMEKHTPDNLPRPSQDEQGNAQAGRLDPVTRASMVDACERLSSERYKAFVENIEEGVYEIDIDGNFLYFNNSLCTIFGYPRSEIQFQNIGKFMDADSSRRALERFHQVYLTGRVSDFVWKTCAKDGTPRVIALSANLIRNRDSDPVGFRGIVRDITERYRTEERLRESERRYKALLDFVPYPIIAFTLEGLVSYLNPAFTDTFGWTLEELDGKTIPFVPAELKEETFANVKALFEKRMIMHHETQRLTKDGRVLDVISGAAVYAEKDEPFGELVILRDITHEKRIARNNEAILRISLALPEYPDLEGLLHYISGEVKALVGSEGALVIFLDEEKRELYFKAVAHDDSATEKRVKEIRFPAEKGVSGEVIRTGEPVIVEDTSQDPNFYPVVDVQAGFRTRSLLDVPMRSKERIIGVLCAMNKKKGVFDTTDVEVLNMIAGTVALYVENARFADELKNAYLEVSSLNRAKDKVINHLSHELKTPLSVLGASLSILERRISSLPAETWTPTMKRARRNLNRVLEMQYEIEDIMRNRYFRVHHYLSWLLDECSDVLASAAAEVTGEGPLVERLSRRIDDLFGPKDAPSEVVSLGDFVTSTLEEIRPAFSHREVDVDTRIESESSIRIPKEVLHKVVTGLIKNAVENTPDEGRITLCVRRGKKGLDLVVRDYGVGITLDNQRRIFEGFFMTQETMDYSSKHPYDFNAGGKGADLLRMKIFSERYGFDIGMVSTRCDNIPGDADTCPGRISACERCATSGDCHRSAGTTFTVSFPAALEGARA